jgi:limonene-1,2-epoxide hydrolase
VSKRELMSAFWAAMQANDWDRAASYLAPECVIDWPCSGERIVGRNDFASVQARYPTNTSHWNFDIHRLIADGDTVVSEVTVSDGEQSARTIVLSDFAGDHIARQVEYWPTAYEPRPGREDLTRPTDCVP